MARSGGDGMMRSSRVRRSHMTTHASPRSTSSTPARATRRAFPPPRCWAWPPSPRDQRAGLVRASAARNASRATATSPPKRAMWARSTPSRWRATSRSSCARARPSGSRSRPIATCCPTRDPRGRRQQGPHAGDQLQARLQPELPRHPTVTLDLRQLRGLSIAGSGDIRVEPMKTGNLEASIAGSGDLRMQGLEADHVTLRVAGSGDMQVNGKANSLSVSVAGSGDVKPRELAVDDAKVSISGSGDVTVQASRKLDVRIAGSGDVGYIGSPESPFQRRLGLGPPSSTSKPGACPARPTAGQAGRCATPLATTVDEGRFVSGGRVRQSPAWPKDSSAWRANPNSSVARRTCSASTLGISAWGLVTGVAMVKSDELGPGFAGLGLGRGRELRRGGRLCAAAAAQHPGGDRRRRRDRADDGTLAPAGGDRADRWDPAGGPHEPLGSDPGHRRDGVITMVTRAFFMIPDKGIPMPDWLRDGLRYAPLAALAAVIVPEIVMTQGELIETWKDARLFAAATRDGLLLLEARHPRTIVAGPW
ncbi:putative auto-transporter adhesin, head GIN domain-containing protein [Ditylenchus destructor]|nr:putative auto-transporter adhesin, head GIN domain-containing protein [Ditylenchus destructor]